MCASRQSDLFSDGSLPATETRELEQPAEPRRERPAIRSIPKTGVSRPRKPKSRSASALPSERVWMSVRDVAAYFALSVPTIWRRAKDDPAFPKAYRVSPGATRWLRSDLERYSSALRGDVE